MERIKQAIDKAKKRDAGKVRTVVRQVVHAATLAADAEEAEIQYVSTEIVPLDHQHLERHRIVAYDKNNPNGWMFDVLRTKVLQIMAEKGWRTLAITSPSPEAGKTVLSINLAMSIAHQTQRTAMLVDFDLRRPKVKTYLGLDRDISLNDVLAGEAELPQAMVNPEIPRLVVVPTNRPVAKSSEVLSSRKVANMITELRERYKERIVIFDLPPVLAADDAIAVLPQIDCVLMVVGNGMSTKRDIEESMRHLQGCNLLGVVMNKAELPSKTAYYY